MSTIAELFARDPLKHSQQDLETIVTYFRQTRKDFKESGVRARTSAPKLNAKEQEAKSTGLDFDL